ncbi:MAG: GAF domain-containing protein [Bacteroidetes bacterium]|nr:GAF domain-containing protein [Bacteroidota bacterium]
MAKLILTLIISKKESEDLFKITSKDTIGEPNIEGDLQTLISIEIESILPQKTSLFIPISGESKDLLIQLLKTSRITYKVGKIDSGHAQLLQDSNPNEINLGPFLEALVQEINMELTQTLDFNQVINYYLNNINNCYLIVTQKGKLVVGVGEEYERISKDYNAFQADITNSLSRLTQSSKNSVEIQLNTKDYLLDQLPGLGKLAIYCIRNKPQLKITESEASEQKLFLNTITESQQVYLKEETTRKGFELLLNQLLSYTESSFGFIGEVKTHENNARYLVSHALSNIAWDDASKSYYEKSYQSGIEFRNTSTLFGQTLLSGEVYISNSPETDPNSGGVPHGHPKLHSYIGIPFYFGDEFTGMIGLANKKGGYDATLVSKIEPILVTCANLVNAHKSQQQKNQIQEDLKKSKADLESIIISMRDIVFELDENLTITNFWTGDEALLFLPPEKLKGLNLVSLAEFPSIIELTKKCESTLKTGERGYLEYTLPIRGKETWFKATINRIQTKGQKNRLSILIQDYTEAKEWEQTNLIALEKEKQLNLLKSRFISMASHEFRGPLSCIQSSAEIMEIYLNQAESNTEKLNKHIKTIRQETQHLTGLVNEILLLGKTESSNIEVKNQEIDLRELIESISERNKFHAQYKLSFSEPFRLVKSDPLHLEHILENLLSNAIKYSIPGNPIPEVRSYFNESSFSIEIKDYGIGIPEKDKENLFQSFFRAGNVTGISGNGMGLVLVKNFVELHKGTITYTSEENKGTTFIINLPG